MAEPRPRDALGRPLARDADPALIVPAVPERTGLTDDEAWLGALAYLADGRPFHAHELLEMRWRAAPAQDRAAWRGLAQWGAALTHAARGNPLGASRLAERAQETLTTADHVPTCIDIGYVEASCQALIRPHVG